MAYGTLNAGTITPGSGNTLTINEIVDGTAIKDEDAMGSNSATHLATQQSIKAYVDSAATTATTAAQGVGTGDSPTFVALSVSGQILKNAQYWEMDTGYWPTASTETVIKSNWSKDSAAGAVGSDLVVDSGTGVFTYPEVGLYVIFAGLDFLHASAATTYKTELRLKTATDGSTYTEKIAAFSSASGDNYYGSADLVYIQTVADVSDDKFQLFSYANGDALKVWRARLTILKIG